MQMQSGTDVPVLSHVGANTLLALPTYKDDYAADLMEDAHDGLRQLSFQMNEAAFYKREKRTAPKSDARQRTIEDLLFGVANAEYEELQSELGILDPAYMGETLLECIEDPCGPRDNFLSKAGRALGSFGYSEEKTRAEYRKAATRVAEAHIDWSVPIQPKAVKPKDERSSIYRKIDKAVKGMSREISDLDLNTLCNGIVKHSDFDANAQAYLIKKIALNAHMDKHAAKAAVKESKDAWLEKNQTKKKTSGNIINQDDHKDQVAYARDSLKKAHAKEPTMFRYGAENGRVEHVPEEGTTSVDILGKDGLRAVINKCTDYRSVNEKGNTKGVSTPVDVVSDLYQEQLPIPYLRGVSSYPQFDANGKFLATNGYHASPYLFIQLPEDLVIPAVSTIPSKCEVSEALRLLVSEWLADFPFDGYTRRDILLACGLEEPSANEVVKPVPTSLANFLAFVLQPLVRPIIGNRPMPATLITKPESGTGASLLVSLVQLLITGKPSVRPPFPSDQDEQRKEVLTALRGGDPFIFLDNVVGNMDSPVLAALLTSVSFTGRILGRSEEVSVPNTASTIITGNNPRFTRELQRRLSLVRLDAGVPNPDKRGDWHLENIEDWTEKNRGQLLWALATLVMNWQANNRPKPEATPLASYSDWHNVCGGIVECCGLKSFQTNRDQIEQVAGNDDDDPMREFVFKWYEVATKPSTDLELAGVFAKELSSLADAFEIDLPVKRHVVDGERLYNPNAFGKFLGQQSQRVFAVDGVNLRIEPGEKTKSGKPWWLVVVPVGK